MSSTALRPMVLICNARSGRRGVGRALPRVRSKLEERGLAYEIRHTEHRGHATRLAREAVENGAPLVVAVGGDGTIHEVVNGMIANDVAVNPEAMLGVLAAGTGSDFIKTFGLPSDPAFAVHNLEGTNSFPIDIGKVTLLRDGAETVRYFANVANVGLGADAVARAEKLPRWLGPTVYFFAFWLTIRSHRSAQVEVDLVDRVYRGYLNNMVVANGQYIGGGMKVAPRAAPTDGLFDIQIEHARKREAIALVPKLFKGEHVPHPAIEEAKRVKVSISSDRELRVEADGEILGRTPATFEVLPEALLLKV